MSGIFINYQTADSALVAAHMDKILSDVFGADQVFYASRSIPLAKSFDPEILARLRDSDVLLVLIGQRWFGEEQNGSRQRIDNPEYWPRREIIEAFAHGVLVVPVMLERMPRLAPETLPAELAELADLQSVRLDHQDLDTGYAKLVARLGELVPMLGIIASAEVSLAVDWWTDWAAATTPSLPSELLIAGRDAEAAELRLRLDGPPAVTVVSAPARAEALAFAVAVLRTGDHLVSPGPMVVTGGDGWSLCLRGPASLVLIADHEEPATHQALAAGHHVIIPAGPGQRPARNGIRLPRLSREAAAAALHTAGLPLEQADTLAAVARRNLMSLRRRLAVNQAPARPGWASELDAGLAATLLLAGSWEATDAHDQVAVAELTGRGYAEVERALRRWEGTDDPPLRRAGRRWRVADPVDNWLLSHPMLADQDLTRWFELAVRVLTEPDPRVDLGAADQATSQLVGPQQRCSNTLRLGLAGAAALLGAEGETELAGGHTAAAHAERLTAAVLDAALTDRTGLLWRSLSELLPQLAEAAPRRFLAAVDRGLTDRDPLLASLFQDSGPAASWGRAATHVGLLWALECLCWSPEHLPDAADALARLAVIDPGGRVANRPHDSLRRIFLPLRPCTAATAPDRLAVLNGLRIRHPEVGWRLLLDLLPSREVHTMRTATPMYRDWLPTTAPVTEPEWAPTIEQLVDWAVTGAGVDPRRWCELLRLLDHLAPAHREPVLAAVTALAPDSLDPADRLDLWRALTAHLDHHRNFPEDAWTYSAADLARLTGYADTLEPPDSVEPWARLFAWTDLDDGTELRPGRVDAIRQVFARSGVPGLARLAAASTRPELVGVLTPAAVPEELDAELWPLLGEAGTRLFAMGWAAGVRGDRGWSWVEETWSRHTGATVAAKIAFLQAMPGDEQTWQLVADGGPEVEEGYWRTIGANPRPEHAERYIIELLRWQRPWLAISYLSLRTRPYPGQDWVAPVELVERVLEAAATSDLRQEPIATPGYHLARLLDHLMAAGAPAATVVRFECLHDPLLTNFRPPRATHNEITANPRFFVDLAAIAQPVTGGRQSEQPVDEGFRGFAIRVLSISPVLPGRTSDGGLDRKYLIEWVRAARTLAAERGCLEFVDNCIGTLLAGAPLGDDGAWPDEAVRDIVESIADNHLAEGLSIGFMNRRRDIVRENNEGDRQEKMLSGKLREWSTIIAPTWIRSARLLREMADWLDGISRALDQRGDA